MMAPRIIISLCVSAVLAAFFGGCTGEIPIGSGDGRTAGPAYFPNGDGSHWSYSYRQYLNNVPYGDISYIAERFDGEREVNGVSVQEYVSESDTEVAKRPRISFVKDNDKSLVELYGKEARGPGDEGVVTEIFTAPWQYLPYPLQIGKSWQYGYGTDLSPIVIGLPDDIDEDGQPDSVDVEVNCYISTKEDISTPAGYFTDCFKIKKSVYVEYYLTAGIIESLEFTQYHWFCPEVGFVRSIGEEVGFPNGPQLDFSRELVSFEIVEEEM